ncbi:LapA family protein [Pseudomonas sp. SWRI18]|nr:LapA family protein [Pseudomonas sp. SWRI18]
MLRFRCVLLSLVIVVVVLAIMVFVLENRQSVVFSFLGTSGPEMPASVFVTLSLIIGFLIGPMFSALMKIIRRS